MKNKRFYATGIVCEILGKGGKLLNACADIPCKAMENTDVLKKAVGEDTLIYEKKDRMQSISTLMRSCFFYQ